MPHANGPQGRKLGAGGRPSLPSSFLKGGTQARLAHQPSGSCSEA